MSSSTSHHDSTTVTVDPSSPPYPRLPLDRPLVSLWRVRTAVEADRAFIRQIFLEALLAGEVLQAARAQAGFELLLVFVDAGGYQAVGGHG